MAIPKIALIPSGVKAGKLYSVLPTNGDGDFTTTRASVATRVNENGLIEEVASNVPRLDYSDGGCPSLLLEPTATNPITYSEDFSDASWTKAGNAVVTPNNAISPDGTLNASTVTGLDGTGTNDLYTQPTFNTSNKTVTYSVYLKGSGTLRINVSNNIDDNSSKTLTLTNNWEKYFITYSFNASTSVQMVCNLDDLSATATTYEVWGAQLEENSYATSYIPTQGSPQTRVADTANGSGNSTVINSSEGTIYVEGSWLDSNLPSLTRIVNILGVGGFVQIRTGSATNRIQAVANSGVDTLSLVTTAFDVTTKLKIAFKYKLNDFALWVNGTEIVTDLSGIAPVGLNELRIENNTKVKSLQVYTTALSDVELEKLTSWTSFTAMANALNYTII